MKSSFVLLYGSNMLNNWAVVVAQVAERSLPTVKVCSSNAAIGESFKNINLLTTVLERRK